MEFVEYTEEELEEIRKIAENFKKKNFFLLPALFRGNEVANRNPDSKIRNYSTITACLQLSTGKWIYLVYAYPLSIIHRILDAFVKWATEKYCRKAVLPKNWKESFIKNSFIPIIPVDIKNVVAMPYIDNENLFDILTGRVGNYTFQEKERMILDATKVINEMHDRGIVWGELITPNFIRSQNGEIILCDTETTYYRGSLEEQKASDWLDFICSATGSISRLHPGEISDLIGMIVCQIRDNAVRRALKEKCERKRTILHKAFFLYTQVRLACPPALYERVKSEIFLAL